MQRTPAGLPFGMPGIALVMDGAIQHAPQFGRQFMLFLSTKFATRKNKCSASRMDVGMQSIYFKLVFFHGIF
jgi:hypothetical protein